MSAPITMEASAAAHASNRNLLFVVAAAGSVRRAELPAGWVCTEVGSAHEALTLLKAAAFDAVVADVELPGVGGAHLQEEVLRRQPSVVRVLRYDRGAGSAVLKLLGHSHQLIPVQVGFPHLVEVLERAFARTLWLPNEAVQRLIAGGGNIPSPPDLYFEVVKELQSEYGSLVSVGGLIARDPSMAAKLLQWVNSAAFGMPREITDVAEAVSHIGLDRTLSLMLLAHSFSYFDPVRAAGLDVDALWRHSATAARFAECIMLEETANRAAAEAAYAAGLLHDLGKLVIATNWPAHYQEARELARKHSLAPVEAERQTFGANHAEVGATLAGAWGLPPGLVEAVALHHQPAVLLTPGFSPLAAVHAGDALAHELAPELNLGMKPALDLDYLQALGVAERIAEWRSLCARALTTDNA